MGHENVVEFINKLNLIRTWSMYNMSLTEQTFLILYNKICFDFNKLPLIVEDECNFSKYTYWSEHYFKFRDDYNLDFKSIKNKKLKNALFMKMLKKDKHIRCLLTNTGDLEVFLKIKN
jgi:hypothetical protein